jgi:hypothetical protein
MFKNMADARSCEDEDAGAVQSQILEQLRYILNIPSSIFNALQKFPIERFLRRTFLKVVVIMTHRHLSSTSYKRDQNRRYTHDFDVSGTSHIPH